MSGTSAKRYGIEAAGNLELERRLRGIEIALSQLAPANADAANQSASRGAVPQVTGLSVTGSTPGAVSIAWNAVSISDLRRYELEFSTTAGFSENKQTARLPTTAYSFSTASSTGGGGGTVWYARVRAVNSIAQKGVWSATLNLTTGQAQTEDIGEGEVTGDSIDPATSAGAFTVAELTALIAPLSLAAGKLAAGLKGHLGGLYISRASATTISVSAGSTSTLETQLASAMVKSTAGAWVAGTGNNGMGNGLTIGNNLWYHVFLIKNDTTLAIDVSIDTSLTGVNALAGASGYTRYRRLGSVLTDGSAQIIAFTQVNEEFTWTAIVDEGATLITNDPITFALDGVPLGIQTTAILNVYFNAFNGRGRINMYSLDGDNQSPTEINGATNMAAGHAGGSPGDPGGWQMKIRTDTLKQIGYHGESMSSVDAWEIGTVGWLDDGLRGAVASDTN